MRVDDVASAAAGITNMFQGHRELWHDTWLTQ